jgi:ethanolamine utilization protein EutP (predicted NTPase)
MKQAAPIRVRQQMGRPRRDPETVRSNRVVTFVTKSELAKLERIAEQERISLSASIHQILTKFFNDAERCKQLSNVVE